MANPITSVVRRPDTQRVMFRGQRSARFTRFRVIAHKGAVAQPPDRRLKTLHQSPGLIIQGEADVFVSPDRAGQAFLVGAVVGARPRDGERSAPLEDPAGLAPLLLSGDVERCRNELEGHYLLALVDEQGTCLISADRFGQMDLYIQETSDSTVFATDLSLLPVAHGSVAYDQVALAHTLCVYGYRPPKQHTLYHGVKRLGVDQWVRIAGGGVSFQESDFQPLPTAAYSERELNEYADILLDAVRARASRAGNIVYLSSGWDSTALLACLVKLFGPRKVRAVIGRMQYAQRSGVINQFELTRARAIAEYYGVRLDVVEFDYRSQVPDLNEWMQAVARPHQLHAFNVNAALLTDHVARTGDGDEPVFAGEVSDGAHNLGFSQFTTIFHPVLAFREYSDKMASYLFGPTFLQLFVGNEHASDPIYGLLRDRCGGGAFDAPAKDACSRRKQLLASFFLRSRRIPLWSLRNSRFLTEAGREVYTQEMESTYLRQAAEALTPETLYAWYLHLYNSFHWQSSTVTYWRVAAEACGRRVVLPFWDSRLQEFLFAMPESWGRGLDLNPTKYPLKWAMKHRIDFPFHLQVGPHSYLYDIDPTFSHTAELLYGSAFAPYFRELLRQGRYRALLSPIIFDIKYIEGMVCRYLEGTEVCGAERDDLFSLCMLSMVGWYGNGA